MDLLGFTNWSDDRYQEIEDHAEEEHAWQVTVQYMKKHGYKFTGTYHQNGEYGTPFFDTKQKLCLSLRTWGALMAEVSELPKDTDNKYGLDMSYCHWAWLAEPDEFVLPDQTAQTNTRYFAYD